MLSGRVSKYFWKSPWFIGWDHFQDCDVPGRVSDVKD
jgi:hypothetical protein